MLGVTIIGSITTSSYAAAMAGTPGPAGESIGGAVTTAAAMGGEGAQLLAHARDAFMTGAAHGVLAATGVAVAGALIAWLWLPARAPRTATVAGRARVSTSS